MNIQGDPVIQPQAGPGTPVLDPVHRGYLSGHAISDAVIDAAGLFSEGDRVVFPWRDGGLRTLQRRQWPEPEDGLPDGVPKYLWEPGHPLHLWEHRPVREGDGPVLIVEGTKQSLAVASWAPPEYAVYGMPGCDPGREALAQARLDRFAGHRVLIMLDADASDNLNVYEGGEKVSSRCVLEGAAGVLFIPSPAWGKDGIDDFLASVPDARRTGILIRLLEQAMPKPSERKPTRRKMPDQVPDTGGRPVVVVNKDKLEVIREILGHMQQRWNGTALFCYGGVLTRLRGAETEPLDKDSFARWMAEAVATYKYRPPGAASPGSYEAAWPEPQTLGAMLASGEEFAPLTGVSRTPFARPDGTICSKNGWDYDPGTGAGTQAVLVTGNSGMDRLDVPHEPDREQAAEAADCLLRTWLGDDPETGKRGMPWRDEASRANALALILTPFLRGIVPLAPLAVISGLQMGVGKNLLADCISLMTTGENVQPLPWIPDDDDEIRKQILSSFRAGSQLVCFDEAHVIGGPALTRAITATTYADRILGVSKMASYPNRVTWMALGNQVTILADMARRAYFIELYPEDPDPENRPGSAFRHEDPRGWTLENRPELVTAALTMIRAWFAAGQPAYSRGSLMGSFEAWDRIMSGIIGYAGIPGFLGNLTERRAERDTTSGYWADHLAWLRAQFGTGIFTALDVKTRAMASGGTWDAPPRLDEPGDRGFTRNLGSAYARNQRWFGPLRIAKIGTGHGTKVQWQVQERGDGIHPQAGPGTPPIHPSIPPIPDTGRELIHPVHPIPPAIPVGNTAFSPGMDRMDGMDQSQDLTGQAVVPGNGGVRQEDGGVAQDNTITDLRNPDPSGAAFHIVPGQTLRDGWDGLEGLPTLGSIARAGARAHAHAHTREWGGYLSRPSDPSRGLIVAADLETADAGRLFLISRGAALEEGGFVRLAGILGPNGQPLIEDISDFTAMLDLADRIDGHNFLGFDGLALAWHHGMDWNRLAGKIRDTELIARQVNPPRSRESGSSTDKYDLDHVAAEMGLPGKTDELARLAAKHGGWGAIPLDDPEYRSYLEGDLRATAAVSARLMPYYDSDPYIRREHKLAEIAGQMALNGFRVDQDLLTGRLAEVNQAKAGAVQALHDGWGLPLSRMVMKGRGKAKHEETEVFASPLATDEGKAWLAAQFGRYQVPDPPRTPKSGDLATGADVLRPIAADPACPGELREMLALMETVTTARTVYQTATEHLAPDGRVHPRVSMRQASGRWSVTKPGLTVFGKRGGRHVERDIFIADDDDWVILSCDLSQVDMRAMAGHCQDPAYMAMFAPGRDPHTEIAMQVFGSADRRHDAKAVGHGWNYGLGPARMIRNGMDPEKVYGFVNGMEARFGGLMAWREVIRAMGSQGQILDNGFGRRMRCDPDRAYTVAPALMGQGGARDIMCESLLRLPCELYPFLRVMVHDEIVLSVPGWAAEEIGHVVRDAMTWTWRDVPILCDMNMGRTWGEVSDH